MSPGGGPRLLLRRLREIMAEQTSAQMRLDKLVSVIASNMVAEVCSSICAAPARCWNCSPPKA